MPFPVDSSASDENALVSHNPSGNIAVKFSFEETRLKAACPVLRLLRRFAFRNNLRIEFGDFKVRN